MKYNLEFTEKTLENGMRVILVHKKDYEKSLFLAGIPAGGTNIHELQDGREKTYRTGIAHFLEHQMFRLNGEDVTDAFALMQAQSNAYTGYTETAYFFSTTADPIRPLKLLLDFVQTLDIDEASVEKEKGIILSEFNMYYQQPESRLVWETLRSMYRTHPLRTEILGDVQDIQDMQVSDLRSFYNTHYDPSHLVLIGITGRETGPILKQIEEHEKQYPSRESTQVERLALEESAEVAREHCSLTMDISKPYISVAYKMQPVREIRDALKTDLAVSMWLDGVFGPLNPQFQEWIDSHVLSSSAGAECDFTKENAYVLFYAQTDQPRAFEDIVTRLTQEKRLDEETFRALKVQYTARNLRSLDNFETLAGDLLHASLDGYDYLESLDLIRSLSLEEVNDILSHLDFTHRAITEILPEKTEQEA